MLFAAVAFATVALADTVTADADVVTVGTQTSVNLGTVAPGASITRSVGFTLVCAQKKHVDLSESVTIEFRAVGSGSAAPSGGSLTATNTSIGPVPAAWPDDDANCPTPTPELGVCAEQRHAHRSVHRRHLHVHRLVPHRHFRSGRHRGRQQLGRHGSGESRSPTR